jgi:hypothetical protein
MHRDCRAKEEPCKSCVCGRTDRDKPANYRESLSEPLERGRTGEQYTSSEITHGKEKTAQIENKSVFKWIDAIKSATVGLNGFEGFCAGNAIKYLFRWKHKNGVEDLKKSQVYIDWLIEEQENE